MENFLSGRPTVAKLNFATKKADGGAFTPLFEKPFAPSAAVQGGGQAPETLPPGPSAPEPAHTHTVQVEVVRVEGVVQGIVVICKCGERIELDCVY